MKKNKLESQRSDYRSSYFPSFRFSFIHKTPKVLSTCVEYRATYDHWNKGLRLYRTIWDDNSRKIASFGGEKEDDTTTKDRTERCYDRCKQPKNTIVKCDACYVKENGILGFEGGDAWRLFYDHATFEEVITPTAETITDKPKYDLREKVEFLPSYPCTGSFPFHDKKCIHATCPEEIIETPISKCPHYYDYCKKWLEATRDNQDYFIHRLKKEHGFDEAMTVFMRVLHAARWHMDKEERETARNLLLDHLVPTHVEHKTGFLPHYKILVPIREILRKLASNLSRKCKDGYLQGENLNDPNVWKEFVSWALENDLRISNIASSSKEAIAQLIRTPANYANSFMAKHYHISVRTLKMSLKESVAGLTRLY